MRILFPDAQFHDDAVVEREVLGGAAELVVRHERSAAAIDEAEWATADALICAHEVRIDPAVVDRLKTCRIIVRCGVGYDQIDLVAAGARGIPVSNVPDYGTTEVADHAIALMLALARGLVSYHQRLIADPAAGWDPFGAPLVRRLRETTFGVIGLGRIGMAAARRARGHDMHVLFYDPNLPDGAEWGIGMERAFSLEDVLGRADVLSLHCPLTPETRHLIDARALELMKPDALLINTARGAIIDIDALEAALREGRIGGAGLDVLPTEPPDPDHSLIQAFRRREPWSDGRLLLTPHAAWYSEAGRADLRRKAARQVQAYLEKGELRNCVNPAHLLR